jgi:hypothetical protein
MVTLRFHSVAICIALIFAAIYASEGILFRDYNLDEFQVATGYLKDRDPSLFPKDFIWSKPEMVRNLHVCVRNVLEFTNRMTFRSIQEPIDLFLIWLPIGFVLFFIGNYLLSYEFTHNGLASLFVASCFMLVRRTVYDWWGIGPMFTMSARGLVLSCLPLGLWFFFQCYSDIKKLAFFSLIWGLISNLHPLSGWGFMEFLGLTILCIEKFRPQAFGKVFLMAVSVLLGSLPFLLVWNKVAIVPEQFQPDPAIVKRFLDFYLFIQPDTPKYIFGFLSDLAIPLIIALIGFFYFRSQNKSIQHVSLKIAGIFPLVVLGTVLGIVALGTVWKRFGFIAPVMTTEHGRNIKMVYLTLPIWMGFGFSWWLERKVSFFMKNSVAITVVFLCLIINFPGHKLGRYFLDRAGWLSPSSSQKFEKEIQGDAADLELSLWAREKTSKDALFYFDSYEFRYYARRSLIFCSFDRPCIAFHPSREMEEWNRRYDLVTPLKKDGDSQGMFKISMDLHADYLVLMNTWKHLEQNSVWSNEKYSVFAVPKSDQ